LTSSFENSKKNSLKIPKQFKKTRYKSVFRYNLLNNNKVVVMHNWELKKLKKLKSLLTCQDY